MRKKRIQSKTVAALCVLAALCVAPRPPARSAQADECTCNIILNNSGFKLFGDRTVRFVQIDSGSTLFIGANSTLTIAGSGPSELDGDIILTASDSVLKFECSNHEVTGSGKIIGQDHDARIEIAAGVQFTNDAKIIGRLQITGAGKFVNDRQVGATADEEGSGTLTVSVSGGIEDSVLASWNVTKSDATLRFRASVCLKGGFVVSAGTLRAGADSPFDDIDVVTKGDLTHTGGAIVAGNNDSFTFNGTCP